MQLIYAYNENFPFQISIHYYFFTFIVEHECFFFNFYKQMKLLVITTIKLA